MGFNEQYWQDRLESLLEEDFTIALPEGLEVDDAYSQNNSSLAEDCYDCALFGTAACLPLIEWLRQWDNGEDPAYRSITPCELFVAR